MPAQVIRRKGKTAAPHYLSNLTHSLSPPVLATEAVYVFSLDERLFAICKAPAGTCPYVTGEDMPFLFGLKAGVVRGPNGR